MSPAPASVNAQAALVLTPGASAGRDQSALVAIDDAVSKLGVAVERVDFPYRLAGRARPDAPQVLARTITEAAGTLAAAHGLEAGGVLLGGRSMGGRMCSMAAAEGFPARGLVLVSYPLHPPGRPDRMRTDHFPMLSVPCLFVSGTRDAFGTPVELERATKAISGAVTQVWVEGGDHSLRRRDAEVASAVAAFVEGLLQPPRRKARKA